MWLCVQVFAEGPRRQLLSLLQNITAMRSSMGLPLTLQPVMDYSAQGDAAPGIKLKPNYNISAASPEAKRLIPTHLGEFWQSDHWPTFLVRSSACICMYDECSSTLMCFNINNKHSNYRTFVRKRLLLFLFWGKAETNKCGGNEIRLIYWVALL